MDALLKALTVFGLGVIELWGAIPAGFALGLSPWIIGICSAAGAIAGAFIVAFLGERVRAWVLRHRGGTAERPDGWVRRIWDRYGLIGLGLLAPLLTGAPLGAALGIAFGSPPRLVIFWISLGVILWAILLTLAAALGLEGLSLLTGN